MNDIRSDLLDRGVFQMPGRTSRDKNRVAPRLYEGGELPAEHANTLALDMTGNYTSDESKAVAKRIGQGDGKVRFFIKFSTDGVDRGHMLNPRGMYFNERDLNASSARRGTNKYEFQEVKEVVFRDYISFLTTKDTTYLRSAERQALNA